MSNTFSWSTSSTPGTKKSGNDDSFIICSITEEGSKTLENSGSSTATTSSHIFAISDGMGGENAGCHASKTILTDLINFIPSIDHIESSELIEQLADQLEKTHQKINDQAALDENLKGMGATLTLAWFTSRALYLIHVGDSRIYLHRDGETSQLSEDHSFVWKQLKRGEISEYKYRNHPRRPALYEVLGGGHRKANPSITVHPYQAGDKYMICSDGLIDGLWQKHIHNAFISVTDSTSSLREALLSRSLENDNSDDTTLIVLEVSK